MPTAPTFVDEQETTFDATTPKNVAASLTANANDMLVEAGVVENTQGTLGTPTGGTSVTRTLREEETAGVAGVRCGAYMWTAPVTSGQSFTPSFNRATGTEKFIGTALLFRGTDGVGATNSTNNAEGSGAPSLSITTTQDNSAVVVVVADWNAGDGSSRTWNTVNSITPTSGNGYERSYVRDATAATYYVAYYPDVGAAGSKTVGLSAPSTMRYVICAVEITGSTPWPPDGTSDAASKLKVITTGLRW
jgi:hypothetical protein